METQPPLSRHFVSECALPETPDVAKRESSYVVLRPDTLTVPQFKAAALALIADAGLPAMQLSASECLSRNDEPDFKLFAYEGVFDTIAVYANAATQEEALASFSSKLNAWARNEGLLPTCAGTVGKELASA